MRFRYASLRQEKPNRIGPQWTRLLRTLLLIILGCPLLTIAVRAEPAKGPPPADAPASHDQSLGVCAGDSADECGVSKGDFKKAQQALERGLKLKDRHPEQALSEFDSAVSLVPRNARFLSTRAMFVQQIAYGHIQRGNQLMAEQKPIAAAGEFHTALELDPGNQFALERLLDATHVPPTMEIKHAEPAPEEVSLHPKAGKKTMRFSTSARGAYTTIGQTFGISVVFDSSTPNRRVDLDLDAVTFEQAMNTVGLVTGSFWTPISSNQVLVAADNPAKRQEFDRPVQRTFYLPDAASAQELTQVADLLRKFFEIRSVTESLNDRTLTVRGPEPLLAAATLFLRSLWIGRPQVMIDFEVYEISGQMLRDIGITLPSQISMFNLPQSSASVLGSSAMQQLISERLAPSAMNQAVVPAISALVSQAQQPNALTTSTAGSVLTFGGGKSTIAVPVPSATGNFSKSNSWARSVSRVSMRASQGQAATFRLGTRYPVMTMSYSGSVTTIGSAPAVSYVDLGITIKATPVVHGGDVTITLDMDLSSLGAVAFNGIPAINQRKYSSVITTRNNQAIVVAGTMSRTEIKSLLTVPGIGDIPELGEFAGDRNKEVDDEEVLIVVTPHAVSAEVGRSIEVLLPRGYRSSEGNDPEPAPVPAAK